MKITDPGADFKDMLFSPRKLEKDPNFADIFFKDVGFGNHQPDDPWS